MNLPPVSPPVLAALEQLVAVVARLRSPDGGCPWDLEQTPQSLIPYVLEEAYEVADALRRDDRGSIIEELGDLLLQVVLQSQVAQDQGQFSLEEVAQGIADKLVRRHPHVFGTVTVADTDEVRRNWEAIKAAEKAAEKGSSLPRGALIPKLQRYGQTLPPLTAATKISRKAAAAGFEWETVDGVWDKFAEEIEEFREAIAQGDTAHQQAELGDILFTLVQLARWHGLDAAEALHDTNQRFVQRLARVEALSEKPLDQQTPDALDRLWAQAKLELQHPS